MYCNDCNKYWKSCNRIKNLCIDIVGTKNERRMLLSKCVVCDSNKLTFIKEQEASGLLSSLGIRTPLNKIHLFENLLF